MFSVEIGVEVSVEVGVEDSIEVGVKDGVKDGVEVSVAVGVSDGVAVTGVKPNPPGPVIGTTEGPETDTMFPVPLLAINDGFSSLIWLSSPWSTRMPHRPSMFSTLESPLTTTAPSAQFSVRF